MIDRDPWLAEYTSKGLTGDASTTTGSFTCRFFPSAGYKGASRGLGLRGGHSSEVASGLILAEYDAPTLNFGDTVKLTHPDMDEPRYVTVTFPRHTPSKWEIEVDEVG
jgi:hypothetical protein